MVSKTKREGMRQLGPIVKLIDLMDGRSLDVLSRMGWELEIAL